MLQVIVFAASTLLHLIAAAMLNFSVVDADGHPVAHATIDVQSGDKHFTTVTDARGNAHIELASGSEFTYRVRAVGFIARGGTAAVSAQHGVLRISLSPSAGSLHVIGSVTGHARTPFNATPVSQKVYPREAYRDQGQPSVSSVMNQTPGLFALTPVTINPATPLATAYASVRNALPFETPFAIDGEPMSLPSNGTFDLALIPTFALQEVEVVKGPGDVGGNGGGVGGALNFRTAEPTTLRRGTLEIEGDSRGGSFSDLDYDGTEPGGTFAYATMLSDDGSPCCGPVPADISRSLALIKLRETPNASLTLTQTVMTVNLQRSLASLYAFALPDGPIVAPSPIDFGTLAEHFTFVDTSASLDRGADAYSLHLFTAQTNSSAESAPDDAQTADTTSGVSLEWEHTSNAFSFGLSGRLTRGNASSDGVLSQFLAPGSGETNALLRANAIYHPNSKQEFDASIETGSQDATVAVQGDSFVQHDAGGQQARIAWSDLIQPGLSVRAAYGSSAVPAPLDALSGTVSVQSLERATGGDAGIEWRLHGGSTTLSADVYRNATDGVYMPVNDGWVNGPPMVESGAELTLQQFKRVGLGFIAALSLPRTYVSGGNGLSEQNLSTPYRIPYAQGYGEISYKWPRGSRLSLGMSYIGSNNIYRAPAFVSFISNLELSLGSRSKLQLSAENLFDAERVRIPILYEAAGLQPLTIRFMFRQSFGEGALQER